MSGRDVKVLRASDAFQAVSCPASKTERKKPATPFSLRLTAKERAVLDRQAGGRPLGAYIRERLLAGDAQKRRTSRKPRVDEKELAQVLAELGRSRLSSNLNQLAKQANIGILPESPEVAKELKEACRAVKAMRDALLKALGLKVEAEESSSAKAKED